MPKYQYLAQNIEGKKVRGEREAASLVQLYQSLREEELFLISYREKTQETRTKRIRPGELGEFCRELGTLQQAGVPLVKAMGIIAEEEKIKKSHRKIYAELQRLIRQGVSLSDAMEAQGGAFPDLMIQMFRAAESSGKMEQTAYRMAGYYEKEHKLGTKVKNAFVYPCVLLGMIIAVLIAIFVFVLPQFEDLFNQMDTLPWNTRFVLWLSGVLTNSLLQVIIFVIVAGMLVCLIWQIPAVQIRKDKWKIHLPLVGNLMKTVYTARFARTLSSLYVSGLPILTALQAGADTVGNQYIRSQFITVLARVRSGETLSAALGDIDGFVKKFASTILVGEETGKLGIMLDSMADNLEYESEMAISRMVTLLEPLMILVMGIVVGFVMISVIMPIYGSYDVMGGMY